MDVALIKAIAPVAGIGGLALGVFLILFRNVIQAKLLGALNQGQSFIALMTFMVLTWSLALAGVAAWVWQPSEKAETKTAVQQQTQGPNSPAVAGVTGDVTIRTHDKAPTK